MPETISAEFETRRDAEMAVEHLVQEHGLDRKAVAITPVSDGNSAGAATAGADLEDGRPRTGSDGAPALAGRLRVTAEVENGLADKVLGSFATYGGRAAAR